MALQLFLAARIGFRAVSRVLGVLAGFLGIGKAPCPQTVINWVTRYSLVRIQSVCAAEGAPRPWFSNGWIYLMDISIALGTGKILTVLALRADCHALASGAPGLEHLRCVAVAVADSWTGDSIADLLKRVIAVTGRPAAYLKDGGSDLQRAVRLLDEQGLASPAIDDISHVAANLLKYWYEDHPLFQTFLSACGRVSANLKQTVLACLAPPGVRAKARFMNLYRLVLWADKLLGLSPPGGAKVGSALAKLRECLDRLPSCKPFIRRFRDDAAPLLKCQKILKTEGLSRGAIAQCEPLIQTIPTAALRHQFAAYLDGQLDVAESLGLDGIGMPLSTDPIESLFGLAKLHGVGQTKDADRIAMRLPALCGSPTREDAERVLGVRTAECREITDRLCSLTKQRRDVLSHPDRLESLIENQAHVELIPSVKSRSNSQKILLFPVGCREVNGPQPGDQNGYG